ncbi:MAG TPA: PQQ-dependent sugar dehydrogenase, partial [Nitrososphaeraceae archaeon]|nr:PQQ-dependent sugar dehydrogenase [Nitrososphaeraceae archaeon]
SDPVLSWEPSLGLTDIEFIDSPKYGDQFRNNLLVGDITNGNLYFLREDSNRTGLVFDNPEIQEDLVINGDEELEDIILGTGFEGITDIKTGPDGFIYVLTFDQDSEGAGSIYRISPAANSLV